MIIDSLTIENIAWLFAYMFILCLFGDFVRNRLDLP